MTNSANDNELSLQSLLADGTIRTTPKTLLLSDFDINSADELEDAFQFDSRMEAEGERVWVRVIAKDGRRFDQSYLLTDRRYDKRKGLNTRLAV